MSGDAYLLADDAEVEKFYRTRLQKRNIFWPEDQAVPTKGDGILVKIFSPGVFQHMMAYDWLQPTNKGADGAFLADLDHWPDSRGGSCGPLFPCQLTHGTVKSWVGQRVFLGTEHLAAQGWHLFPRTSASPVSPLREILRALSDSEQKQLSGNGMHLPTLLAWKLYVFGNTVRVESVKILEELNLLSKGNSERYENEEGDALDDLPLDGLGSSAFWAASGSVVYSAG